MSQHLLEVRDLKQYFPIRTGWFTKTPLKAVDGVSFEIEEGETLGLVGESGCGKTTVGRTILHLYKPTAGEILYQGTRITPKNAGQYRREMQIVFQDPYSSLNPRMTVSDIVGEPLDIHHLYSNKKEREEKIAHLLNLVGLNSDHARRYAHEFSGGQRQRIGIARALAVEPKFIVCDEPVSALDVSIQAQVINTFEELQEKLGIAYLFIAHDLLVVQHISKRIAVMYLGRIVEIGESEDVISNPMHPYTQSLISAIPIPDPKLEKHKQLFTYDPSVHDYSEDKPEMVCIGHGHYVYGNKKEIEEYKAIREKNVPLKSITILTEEEEQEAEKARAEKGQDAPMSSGDYILSAPVHDTGSFWYKFAGFFLPLLALLTGFLFRRKNYIRNYKACIKGALLGLGFRAALIVLFLLMLVLAVI